MQSELLKLGSGLTSEIEREKTFYSLDLPNQEVERGVRLLGDILSNSKYNEEEFELVKEEVS